MRREEIALAVLRGLVKRPRLADVVFRFDKWGNIVGPDRFVDPYPIYERMRAAGPVSFSPIFQQWAVVGYDEAKEVLSSSSFGVAAQLDLLLEARPYSDLADQTKALLRNALLFTDPPLHTRLRSVVSRAFTPRQMTRLEPRITEIAQRLLADLVAGGGAGDEPAPDLVAGFTEPFPIHVIAELIGVPEDRWAWVRKTSTTLREVTDPFVVVDPASIDATCEEIAAYYSDLADQRLADPREDLLTALVRAEADDGTIRRDELISIIAILLLAGHETTTGALGNAVVALGRHPAQRRLIIDNPDLWPNAVEELLRFDTAIHTDPRAANETTTIAGQTIKKGQNLTIMLGAVNRDPRRFVDPDQLLLDRENPAGLSFGHGIHHCVGAALARLELRIGLQAVLGAFGDYAIDEPQLTWKTSLAFRSPTRLTLEVPGRAHAERAGPLDASGSHYFATTGPTTDIGHHAEAVAVLSADPTSLGAVVRGLLVHNYEAETKGITQSADRDGMRVFGAGPVLDRVLALDASPLDTPRPEGERLIGYCYHFALVHCALLRAKGVPARARCGFANYLGDGKWTDHWVTEHWTGRRWQIDDPQIGLDDLSRDDFRDGVRAWQLCRVGEADPFDHGIGELWGWDELRGSLVNDLGALNKVEIGDWEWCEFLRVEPLDQPHAGLDDHLDRVAGLVAPDRPLTDMRVAFASDAAIRPPDEVIRRAAPA